MIKTLRNRDFSLLWLGGLISSAGDWVLAIGLPIYVYLLTRSVLATSITLITSQLPGILLGSVAGIFVDRWDRRRTLVAANALLALGLLPLLLVRTPDLVWIVYAVAFVEGCLEQFTVPAQNALLPALVGEEHLVAANSLNSVSSNLARLVGPALGGLIAALGGLNGIVLADAVSFVLAGLLIAGIRMRVTPAVTAAPAPSAESLPAAEVSALRRAAREWADGLRVIVHERTLSVLLLMFAISMLGEGVFGVLYPVFVYRILHGQALQIGQLMSAQAVGGLIGGLLVGWIGPRVMSRWVIGLGQVFFGLIDLAIFNTPAFFPAFWLSVGLFVAVGIPGLASITGAQSLLQARTPAAYLGRVFGALGTTVGLLGLIGAVIAGTLTDRFGLITVLNIQGAGHALAGLLMIALLPRARKPATPPASADAPAAEPPSALAEVEH
ncbi:MAG TPA: MFS transporter [Ktedonobacterales bacterium]